jgi:hypothetical protein
MGIGDDIIATSMAKGAAARGEKIAFGDGARIIWGPHSEMIFTANGNIARPGEEREANIRWIKYYKGHRIYNRAGAKAWVWNYDFRVSPGELYFRVHPDEFDGPERSDAKLLIIEPNVPRKPCAPNKQWPAERWKTLAKELSRNWRVCQFDYGAPIQVAERIPTRSFREAAAVLRNAGLAILPEGGLHHAAAAVGCPAIVLFGGFAPPRVLGYTDHVNLAGSDEACGSFEKCAHCAEAMNSISVDQVLEAVSTLNA